MNYFCLLFESVSNEHIDKDVCQLANAITKNRNLNSMVIGGSRAHELSGYYSKILTSPSFFNIKGVNIGIIWYLFLHARKIKFLNLYHNNLASFIYSGIFRLLNRKAEIYLKLDCDQEALINKGDFFSFKTSKLKWVSELLNKNWLYNYDYVTCESKTVLKFITTRFPHDKKRVSLLINGASKTFKCPDVNQKQHKKKIILIGRLTDRVKNISLLLDSLKDRKVKLEGWSFELIGSISEADSKVIDDINSLSRKGGGTVINAHGEIRDKNKLSKLLFESSVLLITSTKEGFPIVVPEALLSGCYIMSTKVGAIPDFLEDFPCAGSLIESIEVTSLIESLEGLKLIDNWDEIFVRNQSLYYQVMDYEYNVKKIFSEFDS